MKYLETLVKTYMQSKGIFLVDSGVIDSVSKLHEYFFDNEAYDFLIEMAFDCDMELATLLQWADEVRRENIAKKQIVEIIKGA